MKLVALVLVLAACRTSAAERRVGLGGLPGDEPGDTEVECEPDVVDDRRYTGRVLYLCADGATECLSIHRDGAHARIARDTVPPAPARATVTADDSSVTVCDPAGACTTIDLGLDADELIVDEVADARGARIAVTIDGDGTADDRIEIWDVATSALVAVEKAAVDPGRQVAWLDDTLVIAEQISARGSRARLYQVDAIAPTLLTELRRPVLDFAMVGPDVAAFVGQTYVVFLIDVTTGDEVGVIEVPKSAGESPPAISVLPRFTTTWQQVIPGSGGFAVTSAHDSVLTVGFVDLSMKVAPITVEVAQCRVVP